MGHPQDGTDSGDRLIGLLNAEVERVHPDLARDWTVSADQATFRVDSPPEPCGICGHRVYLILLHGEQHPRWVRLGEVLDGDSLFPSVRQIRHECGDGESWSVEAALFVETAMASWAREVS